MAQSQAESTWEINNHGKYINQFPPNTIKSIRQHERINKKIFRLKIIFNEICIYMKILNILKCTKSQITHIRMCVGNLRLGVY